MQDTTANSLALVKDFAGATKTADVLALLHTNPWLENTVALGDEDGAIEDGGNGDVGQNPLSIKYQQDFPKLLLADFQNKITLV